MRRAHDFNPQGHQRSPYPTPRKKKFRVGAERTMEPGRTKMLPRCGSSQGLGCQGLARRGQWRASACAAARPASTGGPGAELPRPLRTRRGGSRVVYSEGAPCSRGCAPPFQPSGPNSALLSGLRVGWKRAGAEPGLHRTYSSAARGCIPPCPHPNHSFFVSAFKPRR